MLTTLVDDLRANAHLMLVHFPIALLFTAAALDWAGYWLRRPVITRFGFYLLALGAVGAIAAALFGPEPDPDVPLALFAWHTLFALTTVVVALGLVAARFITTDGLRGRAAIGYLGGTVALLASVSATGYFGGLVLDPPAQLPSTYLAPPLLPAKLLIALLLLLGAAAATLWLSAGRRIAPDFYVSWSRAALRAVKERGVMWTLQRTSAQPSTTIQEEREDGAYSVTGTRV